MEFGNDSAETLKKWEREEVTDDVAWHNLVMEIGGDPEARRMILVIFSGMLHMAELAEKLDGPNKS